MGPGGNDEVKKARKLFERNSVFADVIKIFGVNDADATNNGSPFPYKYTKEKLFGLVINQSKNEEISLLELKVRFLINDTYKLKPEDGALLSKLIILFNRVDTDTGAVLTPGLYSPGEPAILARAFEYSKRLAVELSIKTLPFFNLSNFETLSKKCIFLSKRNSVIGTEPADTFDFFSGEYMITGFRHVISTSECYSEFLLNKFGTSDDGPKLRRYDSRENTRVKVDPIYGWYS